MPDQHAMQTFMMQYAPYRVKGYTVPVRDMDDIPEIAADHPELRILAHTVDEKRAENPNVGILLAGKELLANLVRMLQNERGVHAETLIAILGAMSGYELSSAILHAAADSEIASNLSEIGVMIAGTKGGEKYLFGDLAANEFCSVYMTAANCGDDPLPALKPIAAYCAGHAGKSDYWKTPYDQFVKATPKELTDQLAGRFETTFLQFTRFPHERPMAFAAAAQSAIQQAETVLPKKKALAIFAEFGWRTAHYIG